MPLPGGYQNELLRAGDVVWFPPGRPHWEGGTPDEAMSYVALQEEGDAGSVAFLATVTDEEYRRGPSTGS